MNKFIPLFLGLMFPVAGAMANSFTDEAVEFCRSKGGSYVLGTQVEEGDNYCRQVTCKKTNAADGRYEIPEGATGPEANVEATKRVCLPKSQVDGQWTNAGSTSGSAGGSNSGSNGGANSGSAGGSSGGKGSAGSGSGSGGSVSDDGGIFCETKDGQTLAIGEGHACYHSCKAKGIWPFRKKGLERKECVECLMGKGYDFPDSVKREAGVVMVGGVSVKVCRDANGREISRDANGNCPSGGSVSSSGTINVGFGNGGSRGGSVGAGGSISVGGVGGVGGGVSGGVTLPEFCHSTKKKDIEECEAWMQRNKRFLCSSSANPSVCMGGADIEISSRYSADCINCQAGSRQQSTLSGWAEIIGAIAPPLAHFGAAYVGAKAYQKSNEAWAGAAVAGFEQCRLDHNNYYQYLAANELPGLTPAQQQAMNCNGFNLGMYGGLQNPMLNGWYGAGYTPGFIGGMLGPYGGYNPYGMGGGIVGGIVGGITGGLTGGYVGGGYVAGYPGGVVGGIVGNIGIAGGVTGGYVGGAYPGYVGGYVTGGYVGGYPGVAGGYVTGGSIGGIVGNIGLVGGVVSGYNGGYTGYPGVAGGYVTGGYVGGYPGYTGGYVNGGAFVTGGGIGIAGGYTGLTGGYVAGGYAAGGYAAGGYAGGYVAGGGMGVAGGIQASQGAAGIDSILQQQGAAYQMGNMSGYGYTGAYGAGGYPLNAGLTIGGQLGFGIGW